MGNGEPNHRTVGQVDGTLNESFTKGATTHHNASVVVLNGTRNYLSSRGGIAIDEDYHLTFGKESATIGLIFCARHTTTLSIDDEVASIQELIGYLHGSMQIPSPILLQVKNERLHAFFLQLLQTLAELIVCGGAKTANADVAHLWTNHISSIDRLHRNLVASNNKQQGVGNAATNNAQVDFRSLGTTQTTHNLLLGHFHTSNSGIVDRDDTIASQDTHLLRRTSADGLNDQQGILYHIKLNTNAFEVALQGFVGFLHLLGSEVTAMRV